MKNLIQLKDKAVYRLFLVSPILLALAGCALSPKWPANSHITNATVEVTTPWGSLKQHADQLDTGKAAINSTLPDNSPLPPAK